MTVSSHLYRALFLSSALLVSSIGTVAQSQDGASVQASDRSASQVALDQVLTAHRGSERLDLDLIDDLYSQSILTDGGIEASVSRLGEVVADRRESRLTRANASLAIGHLYWRFGDMQAALTAANAGLQRNETFDGMLLKARLHDSRGETEDAQIWYEKAYDTATDDREREFIRIRLTMINVDDENVNALIDLAGERDQVFQNRAGIALALLGHADNALDLYQILPDDDKIPRRHIRLSEWALVSEEYERAQAEAWSAYQTASSRADRLYGLALLSEAYRKPGELDQLVDLLDDQGVDNEELLDLRIDLLVELDRFQEAIDLYSDIATLGEVSVEARQRLISLYDAAGQTERMIAEYKGLMDSDPHETTWYASLAAQYVFSARQDLADEVWVQFEKANRDRPSVLISGAEEMVAMGYFDEAVAMVERDLKRNGDSAFTLMFLFDKYVDRAENEEAGAILARLEQILAPDAPARVDLADGYERLGLYAEARDVYLGLQETLGELGYDQQMRLAWLYGVVGQKEEALALWREIWVSVQSRARRSMAEEQLLLLSAELGRIGDLAVELEDKLFEGTAQDNEIDLLVNLYVQVGDQFSAIEVTEEFARNSTMGEVEKLERLGRVYQELEDHQSYDDILRRLYEVDEENRVEHIQGIILNLLAHNLVEARETRQAEITQWVGVLRGFDAEAVSGEFEAGIYSMGGFPEAAIAGYRRAIAENPGAGDNLLLLSELLKEEGRTEEAVAMLQYVAEHARDDDLFVIAIDGMINMIGQTSFGSVLNELDRNRFRWAQRIILERITSRDTQFYLYTLLANIAEELNDDEAKFRAIENSLSEAGIRRTSILRELVTLSTPNAGFGGLDTGAGDLDRKVQHGRRLVALKQALPPEVYIELGKTLLDQGDAAGAEKALGEIIDVTGMINIDSTRANMFYDAGYDDRALSLFNRAMVSDQGSYDLIVKTALLRESAGQFDTANALYLRGLEMLFSSQAQVLRNPPGQNNTPGRQTDTSVTRDFRTFANTFEQGALLTWPEGQAGDERLAGLEAMFDAEIDSVRRLIADGESPQLAKYARLDRLSRFLVRVHQYRNDQQGVRGVADALFEVFPDDQNMAMELISNQRGWAWSPLVDDWRARIGQSDAYDTGTGIFSGFLAEAAEAGDLKKAEQLSKITGDDSLMLSILGDQARSGKTVEALEAALEVLDDAQFVRFFSSIEAGLAADDQKLIGLYSAPLSLTSKLHERLGRVVATPEELIEALDSANQNGEEFSVSFDLFNYIAEGGTIEDLLKFSELVISGGLPDQYTKAPIISEIAASLLQEELTAIQKADLLNVIDKAISDASTEQFAGPRSAIELVLNLKADPSNIDILQKSADLTDQYFKNEFGLKPVVNAYLSGNKSEALKAFYEINLGEQDDVSRFLNGGLSTFMDGSGLKLEDGSSVFADEFAIVLRNFANGQSYPDAMIIDALSHANISGDERSELLRQIVSRYPDRDAMVLSLFNTLISDGRFDDAFGVLKDLNSRFDNDALRLAVFTTYMRQGNYTAALAVAQDSETDLLDPAKRADIALRRFGYTRELGEPGIELGYFFQSPELSAARSVVRGGDPLTQPVLRVERLRSALTEGGNLDTAMRGVWRSYLGAGWQNAASSFDNSGWISRSAHFASLRVDPVPNELRILRGLGFPASQNPRIGPSQLRAYVDASGEPEHQPDLLFDALAQAGASPEEFDQYIRALPVGTIADTSILYSSLVTAYKKAGQADAKRADLGKELLAGAISHHHFTLWLLLIDELNEAELDTLSKRLSAGRLTKEQLLISAELAARSGAQELAKDLLISLVIDQFSSLISGNINREPDVYMPVDDIVDVAARILDPDQAAEFADAVVQLTSNPNGSVHYQSMSQAFILDALQRLLPQDEVMSYIEANVPSVLDLTDANGWLKVEQMYAQARAGRPSDAMTTLRDLLDPASQPEPETQMERARNGARNRPVNHAFGYASYTDRAYRPRHSGIEGFIDFIIDRFDSDEFISDQAAREWLKSAGLEAIDLSQVDGVPADAAMTMASVFAYLLVQSGEVESAGDVLAKAFEVVAEDPSLYRGETVDSLLVVLEMFETSPVSANDLKTIAETADLSFDTQLAMLRTASEKLAAKDGVGIAKIVARKFEGVPVFETALKIAKAAGDRAFERQLNDGLSKLERSREQLELVLQ